MLSGSKWSALSYHTYLPGFLVLGVWAAGQSIFSKNVTDPDKSDDKDATWGCREPRVAFFILKKFLYQTYTRGRGTNRVINHSCSAHI